VSYARDHLIPLVDEGLGNSAYLAGLGDGRALAVDASRDLRTLREAAARRGLKVAFAAGTHLHADFLTGAVQLAADDGGPTGTTELVTADRIGSRPVLDVRQAGEYAAGHIPGAVHVELGDLPARIQDAPAGAVVMCGHGERAMTAASLLQRAGHRGLAVLAGGAPDWAAATGEPLREGA
jgi:rhodanese-related sulfurtransferase